MSVQNRLNRIWYDGAFGQSLLAPLAWVYGRIVATRASAATRVPIDESHCLKLAVRGQLHIGRIEVQLEILRVPERLAAGKLHSHHVR